MESFKERDMLRGRILTSKILNVTTKLFSDAIFDKQFEVVKWLIKQQFPLDDPHLCVDAISSKNLDMVKLLRENGCPWNAVMYDYPVRNKDINTVRWLIENGCPLDEGACALAANNQDVNLIEFLRENGCPWDDRTFSYAARTGNLELVKMLKENDCPWSASVCSQACRNGKFEMLKWLVENGCPVDEEVYENIFVKSNPVSIIKDIVEWLNMKGYSWNAKVWNHALLRKDLNMAKWVKDSGCPFDDNTILSALDGGDINIVKWVIENNCSWSSSSVYGRAIRATKTESDALELVKLLKNSGCPWSVGDYTDMDGGTYAYTSAVEREYFNIIKWLINNNCPWENGERIFMSGVYSGLKMLNFLKDSGITFDETSCFTVCDTALTHNNFKIIKWLLDNDYQFKERNFAEACDRNYKLNNKYDSIISEMAKNIYAY